MSKSANSFSSLLAKLPVLLTKRERWQAAILFGLMLLGTLLELVGVSAIPAFVGLLSNPGIVNNHPLAGAVIRVLGVKTPEQMVFAGAALLLCIFSIKNIYLAFQSWASARYLFNRQVAVAQRLLWRYLQVPYTFHLQRNSAELLRNTNQDAMDAISLGLGPVFVVARESLTITAVLCLLLWVEPVTSIAAFGILGGTAALFLRTIRRTSARLGVQVHDARKDMIQSVNEGLGGIKVTRVMGREQEFFRSFAAAATRYSRAGRSWQVLGDVPRLFLETAGIAGLLGVTILLTLQGRPAASLIPTLTLLAVAVVRLIPSFNQLTTALNTITFGRAPVDAIHRDMVDEAAVSVEGVPVHFGMDIKLDGVSYTYPGAPGPTLNDVSLVIRKGDAVGFVGQTGAGKTTLVDIVLGLLTPVAGALKVDGVDVAGNERAWQRHIGYVPQEIFLTDASVRRNVAFGVPEDEIDDAAVQRALGAAQALAFVDGLPDGVLTPVGERGVRLSGGQRQRLGIARALYHDPDVLVLDEATSALDHETEAVVMDAVDRLRGSRTILMIAHRMSTLANCDVLYRVEGGRVVMQTSVPA